MSILQLGLPVFSRTWIGRFCGDLLHVSFELRLKVGRELASLGDVSLRVVPKQLSSLGERFSLASAVSHEARTRPSCGGQGTEGECLSGVPKLARWAVHRSVKEEASSPRRSISHSKMCCAAKRARAPKGVVARRGVSRHVRGPAISELPAPPRRDKTCNLLAGLPIDCIQLFSARRDAIMLMC